MPTKEPMLSVAQVLELEPGDEDNATWINPGFVAIVEKVKSTKSKAGKPMHICTLRDTEISAVISMTEFKPSIPFGEGDTIEVSGQGLRRTEYNGMAQATTGKGTEIQVIERGAAPQAAAPAAKAPNGQHASTTANGASIQGQTVGMAMKESLAVHTRNLTNPQAITSALCSPTFWEAIHETASDIIRVSMLLEKGKLAPTVRERNAEDAGEPPPRSEVGRAEPPKRGARPAPGPEGAAFAAGTQEEVNF